MHFIYTLFPFKNIILRMGGSMGSPRLPKKVNGSKKKKKATHTHKVRVRNSATMPGCNQTAQSAGGCEDAQSAAKRSYPATEVRGGGRECQAATAHEQPRGATLARSQGRRPGGATLPPRSRGCAGAGEPSGAIPRSRSGEAAVRRYPSSKVRSSSCALLGQP